MLVTLLYVFYFFLFLQDDYIAGVRRIARTEDEDEDCEGMEVKDEEEGEQQQQRQELEQEQQLNGKVLYDMYGGTPHGHFPIGNDAVRAVMLELL